MWVKPEFVDVKMDAEIGSYQEDSERTQQPPPAKQDADAKRTDETVRSQRD